MAHNVVNELQNKTLFAIIKLGGTINIPKLDFT
jgi:hypothetical protein